MTSKANEFHEAASNGLSINPTATKDMCIYCFDALVENFTGKPQPAPLFPEANCPLFVTWMTTSAGQAEELRLRGCIGTLEPRHIHKAIKDYALTSALHDRRFTPMTWKEVPRLQCTVSLLTNYEDADHHLDWEIGKHGLIIAFCCPQGGASYSATYLPEIAQDQGWSHEECVESLMRKSGYQGALTLTLKQSLTMTKYQSSKMSLTYEEYLAVTAPRNGAPPHTNGFALHGAA